MTVGIKDVFKLIGIILISACAVFISALFLNYNTDLKAIEAEIATNEVKPLYDALVMTGTVVSAVSGGCLLITSVVMLCFYIGHYIEAHRKELGILKALGYSNLRIAAGFCVFGASVFAGASIGYAAAHCIMPRFYSTQNADGLLPEISVHFHTELFLLLVILPTAAFALLSVVYALIKIKAPVLELLKGRSNVKAKNIKTAPDLPFTKEMRKITLRSRKSLVFFIAFAAFCYSAMVQMSMGVEDLSSKMMSVIMLTIGVILAFATLFIALSTVVRSNAKSISIMRVFGYSRSECSSSILNGYRPAALTGFVIGTIYQYVLLKLTVELVFKNVENLPDFNFDFKALLIAAVTFIIAYEAVTRLYSHKISKLSVKEVLLDSE